MCIIASRSIIAVIWSVLKFLTCPHKSNTLEWVAIGYLAASMTSQKLATLKWETSVNIFLAFNFFTISKPKVVNPPPLGSWTPSAAKLAGFHVNPTDRTPKSKRWSSLAKSFPIASTPSKVKNEPISPSSKFFTSSHFFICFISGFFPSTSCW